VAKRKGYTDEFKREAVGPTRQPGSSVSQVARDIGVNDNQLWRWRREQDEHGSKAFTGPGTARDQEVLALKRELAKVKKNGIFFAMRRRSCQGIVFRYEAIQCHRNLMCRRLNRRGATHGCGRCLTTPGAAAMRSPEYARDATTLLRGTRGPSGGWISMIPHATSEVPSFRE
jgi:transposase